MPESERDKGENPIVDSLAMASDWTVVSKCALHGLIYVWDLKSTVKKIDFDNVTKGDENKVVEQDVTMVANLKWSDTDNFYMNLGCHKGIFCIILTIILWPDLIKILKCFWLFKLCCKNGQKESKNRLIN